MTHETELTLLCARQDKTIRDLTAEMDRHNATNREAIRQRDVAIAERDSLKRHYDAAAPEHNLLALLDMYEAQRRSAIAERDSLRQQVSDLTAKNDLLQQLALQDSAARDRIRTCWVAETEQLRQQVRELTEERDWLRSRDNEQGCAHAPWCEDMGMDNHDPSCPANAVTLQCEASQLRSDLSAALVSMDAMAKRLEQLQPIVSVLGDWDWQAIRDEGCWRGDEYIDAMRAVVKALAHTASEQGKEGK